MVSSGRGAEGWRWEYGCSSATLSRGHHCLPIGLSLGKAGSCLCQRLLRRRELLRDTTWCGATWNVTRGEALGSGQRRPLGGKDGVRGGPFRVGEVGERLPLGDALGHQLTGSLVGLAERDAASRQEIGGVGGEGKVGDGGFRHAVRSPAGGTDHGRQDVERGEDRVDRVEERLFVFLKVL